MIDLDKAQAQADSFFRWAEGYGQERQANFAATAKVLVAELRAAREIGHALERWSALPGMFWGDTPETGSEIGAALKRWQEVAG